MYTGWSIRISLNNIYSVKRRLAFFHFKKFLF